MKSLRPILDPSEISLGRSKILFVEGNQGSIDLTVLEKLVDITVKPIGCSSGISSASRAFRGVAPGYYFLIDRDGIGDALVEKSWDLFRKGDGNLLIWRKKEIENYFLDPDFLVHSRYADKSKKLAMMDDVLNYARRSLYLTAVRNVIITIREELKADWIKAPSSTEDFPDEKSALGKLLSMPEFQSKATNTGKAVASHRLKQLFNEYLDLLRGDASELEWNVGEWISHIPGKKILHSLIHNNRYFKVLGKDGNPIEGKEKSVIVLNDLISMDAHLPRDFKELRDLIKERNDMPFRCAHSK